MLLRLDSLNSDITFGETGTGTGFFFRFSESADGIHRFSSVQATQVSLEDDIDLITKEGIRLCSAHLFLSEFV